MRKILVILNEVYPYDFGESFLENEIKYIKGFNEVIGIPCSVINHKNAREIKNNSMRIIDLKKNKFTQVKILKFFRYTKALFSRVVLDEVFYLYKSKRLSFSVLMSLLSFVSIGNQNVKGIKKRLKAENYSKEDNIIFYSYWMHYHAYVAVRLKVNFPKSRAVTRCHGYDLYEYRNKDNYLPLRKFILQGLDSINSISNDGRNYLEREYPGIKNKLNVSKLGTENYGVKFVSNRTKPLRIVSCSWITPVKRIHKIIEALSLIDNIQIIWTHLGDGELMSSIENFCESSLGSNIKYQLVGALTSKEITEIYQNNDFHIFINVSESEGIPVSIMEALSFGIPIIATDVGGVREIVQDKKNGYLLNKDFDVKSLKDLLYKVCYMNEDEYNELRQNSRKSWDEKYNAEINYTSFFANNLNVKKSHDF